MERDRIRRAVEALPRLERAVLLLNSRHGMDYHAIGDCLTMSVDDVERTLASALKRLVVACPYEPD